MTSDLTSAKELSQIMRYTNRRIFYFYFTSFSTTFAEISQFETVTVDEVVAVIRVLSTRAVFVKFQQGGSVECEARRADARSPKGREQGGVLGERTASPLPTS